MNLPDLPFPVITPRLVIRSISEKDAAFILELLNSPTWLKYIGDRQILSLSEAEKYIHGIQKKTDTKYFVVEHKALNSPIGLLTLIKREYLEFPDFGFAFLPEFTGKGFAFEASQALIKLIKLENPVLMAITTPLNQPSIKLLTKLNLFFFKEKLVDNKIVHIFMTGKSIL